MERRVSILLLVLILLIIIYGVGYFFFRPPAILTPVAQPVLIGIGWNSYTLPLINFDLYYPVRMVIGDKIRFGTPQLFYIWLPTGGIYGFPSN